MKRIVITFMLVTSSTVVNAREVVCSSFDGDIRFKTDFVTGVIESLSPNNPFDNLNADSVTVHLEEYVAEIRSTYGKEKQALGFTWDDFEKSRGTMQFVYSGYLYGGSNIYGSCTVR